MVMILSLKNSKVEIRTQFQVSGCFHMLILQPFKNLALTGITFVLLPQSLNHTVLYVLPNGLVHTELR